MERVDRANQANTGGHKRWPAPLKVKEDAGGGGFDKLRPALTEDGAISRDEQRKTLEYLVNPTTLKEPPRLEKIYGFAIARKVYQELQARGWKPAE